jgi:imidazolonepropionase-like amidohydrolase
MREAAVASGERAEINPSWEAMLPIVGGELPVMVHANEVRQIKAAVQWAESNRFNIILAGARDAWMLAELLASKRIPVIYDNVFELPARDTDAYDVHFRAPAVLQKAGVTVAFSVGLGDMAAAGIRNLPYVAAQAAAFGLPRDEALKGITLYPAEMLGVADRLGSIAPGKEATMFVADGDILDIRSKVKRLWIGGREVPLESRHTRLYEKYRQRPKLTPPAVQSTRVQ